MLLVVEQTPKDSIQQSSNCLVPVRFDQFNTPASTFEQKTTNAMQYPSKSAKKTKQCRICLQTDEQQSRLVAPCKCTGSIAYGHVHCLAEWIKRRVQSNSCTKARCQVCDSEFNYKVSNQRIFDCNQLRKNYLKQKKSILCFGIVYGLFLLFFIVLMTMMIVSSNNKSVFLNSMMASSGGVTILVSVLILFFLGLLVIGIMFISENIVRQEVIISDVMKYKEPRKFPQNYKIYFRK